MAWPEAEAEMVRTLAAENLSGAAIAERVNARFGAGRTASSVIGLCRRRGWQMRETAQSRAVKKRKVRTNPSNGDRARRIAAAEFISRSIPLLELEDWHCRTVVREKGKDGLAEYCGKPKQTGRSYCPACMSRYIDHAATAAAREEYETMERQDPAYTPRFQCW